MMENLRKVLKSAFQVNYKFARNGDALHRAFYTLLLPVYATGNAFIHLAARATERDGMNVEETDIFFDVTGSLGAHSGQSLGIRAFVADPAQWFAKNARIASLGMDVVKHHRVPEDYYPNSVRW